MKRLDFRDEVVSGLVLRVSTSGTKTFSFHKRINGKMKRLTIGRFGSPNYSPDFGYFRQARLVGRIDGGVLIRALGVR